MLRQKREYCLNQSWCKWKLLIIKIMQRNFYQELDSTRKGFKPQHLMIRHKESEL